MSACSPELAQRLIAYIRGELLGGRGPDDLGVDDDLLSTGLIDSLGVMRLIGFLRTELGVTVPPADVTIEHFMTVARIGAYVEQRGNGHGHDA